MAVEIVSCPMNSMVHFHSDVNVYERVSKCHPPVPRHVASGNCSNRRKEQFCPVGHKSTNAGGLSIHHLSSIIMKPVFPHGVTVSPNKFIDPESTHGNLGQLCHPTILGSRLPRVMVQLLAVGSSIQSQPENQGMNHSSTKPGRTQDRQKHRNAGNVSCVM